MSAKKLRPQLALSGVSLVQDRRRLRGEQPGGPAIKMYCLLSEVVCGETADRQNHSQLPAPGSLVEARTVTFRLALCATAFLLSGLPGHAGPCPDEIAFIQSQIDAKIGTIIDTARFAHDARSALGLSPPKKSSFPPPARSDIDAAWLGEAVAALAKAREADAISDVPLCEQALAAARRAMSR
jgi:hypothetical protein